MNWHQTPELPRATTSASNVHRRMRCLGSHWAEHGLPEDTGGETCAEGVLLHARFALPDTGDKFADLSEGQAKVLRYAEVLADEAIEKAKANLGIPEGAECVRWTEKTLYVRRGIKPVIPGHCDLGLYYPEYKALIIIDAKFGYLEVDEAPTNMQLRAYAVGGAEEVDVENACVAIVQPRADAEHRMTIGKYTREDLASSKRQLLEWEAAWTKPGQPRTPSPDACRYCKAAEFCPERNARVLAVQDAAPTLLTGLAEMTPDAFENLWTGYKLAMNDRVQSAIKAEAVKRVQEGRMPSYALKENAPRAGVENAAAALDILTTGEYALEKSDVLACMKLTLGDVEKTARIAHKLKEKEAKTLVRNKLAQHLKMTTPAPSVVEIKTKALD